MDTLTESLAPPKYGIKNVQITFLDLDGRMKTRTYDVFKDSQKEKVIKTLQYAVHNGIELRIKPL